jgi:hypothetical protein
MKHKMERKDWISFFDIIFQMVPLYKDSILTCYKLRKGIMGVSEKSNHRILLVEDNSVDEMLFRVVLNGSRFNTICDIVSNAEDALNFLN